VSGFPLILSSPSGGGKTTIAHELLRRRSDLGYSVSCTTRPPRVTETDGTDYFFLTREAFLAARDRGEFAESAEVHSHLYGTLRREVDIRWRRSARDVGEAAAVQARMLRHAASLVAPGGRLVYATCSSEPEENEGVFEGWLSGERGFRQAGPESLSSDGVPSELLDGQGHLHTRPDLHGLEAFFAAAADRSRAR